MDMSNQSPKIKIKKPNNNGSMDTTLPPAPTIHRSLLAYLQGVFPDRVPKPDTEDRAIWIHVGQVDVVRHLQDVYDQQQSEME